MRIRSAVWAVALLVVSVPAAGGQIRDRLKKVGITIKTGKDSAKTQRDTARIAVSGASTVTQQVAASDPVIATESKANPEILGLKVGRSTVSDAKTALGAMTPALFVEESRARLAGWAVLAATGRTQIPVDSDYVQSITAITRSYRVPGQSGCGEATEAMGNCESIFLEFSPPPDKGRLLNASRSIGLARMPTVESVEKNLAERFGKPTFRSEKHYTNRDHVELTWAWTAEGALMADLPERHLCVQMAGGGFGFNGKAKDARSALLAGCAAAMRVQFGGSNTLVRDMQYTVRDFHGIHVTETKAMELTAKSIAEWEKKDRERAAQVKIP